MFYFIGDLLCSLAIYQSGNNQERGGICSFLVYCKRPYYYSLSHHHQAVVLVLKWINWHQKMQFCVDVNPDNPVLKIMNPKPSVRLYMSLLSRVPHSWLICQTSESVVDFVVLILKAKKSIKRSWWFCRFLGEISHIGRD